MLTYVALWLATSGRKRDLQMAGIVLLFVILATLAWNLIP
jgi:hypothetical protein